MNSHKTVTPGDKWDAMVQRLWQGSEFGYYWYVSENTCIRKAHTGKEYEVPVEKRTVWMPTTKLSALPVQEVPSGLRHIYFGVHGCKGLPEAFPKEDGTPRRNAHSRATLPMIAALNCVYGEFDEAVDVDALPLAPSIVIESSPGKHHCYWLLNSTYVLNDNVATERAKRIQAAWVKLVRSDGDAKDLCRVLRVPGFLNVKAKYGPDYPMVSFKHFDLSVEYPIEEIEALCCAYMPVREPQRHQADDVPADEKIEFALQAISTSTWDNRDAWLQIGMALQAHDANLCHLWDRYSQKSAKYHQGECERLWQGFSTGGGIEIATLFHYADQDTPSWRESLRPAPRVKAPQKPVVSHAETARGDAEETDRETDEGDIPIFGVVMSVLKKEGIETISLNELTQTTEVRFVDGRWEHMTDGLASLLRSRAREIGYGTTKTMPIGAFDDGLAALPYRNKHNAIEEFFNTLPAWDGKDRIADLWSMLSVVNDVNVSYPDGTKRPLSLAYLRRWLISVPAKALHGKQSAMLVLSAPQGTGKTSLFEWLAPSQELFRDTKLDLSSKDANIALASHLVWEIGELNGWRGASQEALKAFITRVSVSERLPYAKHAVVLPARCALCGSTNETNFLTDDTGNRRYMIVELSAIDWSYQEIDKEQLWAQALHLANQGEAALPHGCERSAQTAHNRNYEEKNDIGDVVMAFVQHTGLESDTITTGELRQYVFKALGRDAISDRAVKNRSVARALRDCGAVQCRTSRGVVWACVRLRETPDWHVTTQGDNLVTTRDNLVTTQGDNPLLALESPVTTCDSKNGKKLSTEGTEPMLPIEDDVTALRAQVVLIPPYRDMDMSERLESDLYTLDKETLTEIIELWDYIKKEPPMSENVPTLHTLH